MVIKNSLIILLMILTKTSFGQDSISAYYTVKWKECKKEDAAYFRVKHEMKDGHWMVKDYYITGTVQMVGFFKDKKCKVRDGDFYFYYPNEQLQYKTAFVEGKAQGQFYGYFQDGTLSSEGNFTNNQKDGMFKFYYKSGTVAWYEQYNKGKFVFRELWNEQGQELDPSYPSYTDAFIEGGSKALYFYIKENFKIPSDLKHHLKIEIEVKIHITADGKMTSIQVIGAQDKWIEEEIIRIFNSIEKWYPALEHLRPIDSDLVVPILIQKRGNL